MRLGRAGCAGMFLFLLIAVAAVLPARVEAAHPAGAAQEILAATKSTAAPTLPAKALTPLQLIALVNIARAGHELPPLAVDPLLMGTAQSAADMMAGFHMTSDIGDPLGRATSAGYGKGDVARVVEDFGVLSANENPAQLLLTWSDSAHSPPLTGRNYRHVGAGAAVTADGQVYYVLQAAYTLNGIYHANPSVRPSLPAAAESVSAVQISTPLPDGTLIHVVQKGESLWSIALAYGTHIADLQKFNGLSNESFTIYAGQKLRIPTRAAPTARPPTPTAAARRLQSTGAGAVAGVPATGKSGAVYNLGEAATLTPEQPGSAQPQRSGEDSPLDINKTITTALVVFAILGVGLLAFGLMFRGMIER